MSSLEDSVNDLETRWRALCRDRESLSAVWQDKAADDFEALHWSGLAARMNRLLSQLSCCAKKLEKISMEDA